MPNQTITIATEEIKLLLQSLDHCLATCSKKTGTNQSSPCADCVKAKALRDRLAKLA